MELYCLPYAGATASVYKKWEHQIDGYFHVKPIELPGRGRMFGQTLINSMEALVLHAYETIRENTDLTEYALFGHSLGAMIAFHLTEMIEKSELPGPKHLFISGVLPPHEPRSYLIDHRLPDQKLIERLREIGGMPTEVMEHPNLLRLLLPVIRSDLQAYNGDPLMAQPVQLIKCGITVLHGKEDPLTEGEISGWSAYTSGGCSFELFPGGHFFINDQSDRVTNILMSTL